MKTVLIYLLIILSPATSIMIYFSWVDTSMIKYQYFSLFTKEKKSKNINILENIHFIYKLLSAQYHLYIYLIA